MMSYLDHSKPLVKEIVENGGVAALYENVWFGGGYVPRYATLLLNEWEVKAILASLRDDPINPIENV